MMERRRIFKVVLQISCQLLWLVGMVLGLSGVYLLLNYTNNGVFFRNFYIVLPAALAISGAICLLGSGSLGFWVSVKDSSACLQAVFVYSIVFVFCIVATASALAYTNTSKVDSELSPLRDVFYNYTGSNRDPNSTSVDAIQEELQCCGINNYTDWLHTTWYKHTGTHQVPHSCCNTTFHICNGTVDFPFLLYSKGCLVKLRDAVLFVLQLIVVSSLLVIVVQIIALVSVAQLMLNQNLQEYQILDHN